MKTSGPILPIGWVLRLQGEDLILYAPHGELEMFKTSLRQPQWLDMYARHATAV